MKCIMGLRLLTLYFKVGLLPLKHAVTIVLHHYDKSAVNSSPEKN